MARVLESRYRRKNLTGQKDDNERLSPSLVLEDIFRLLFLLSGLFGILTVLHSFPGLEFDIKKIIIYSGALIAIMFISHRIHGGLFALTTAIALSTLVYKIHSAKELLDEQIQSLYDWFMAIDQNPGDLTTLFLYGALIVGLLIFAMDIGMRFHLLSYILISVAFLLPSLFGSKLTWTEILLMGAFQFFFFADAKTARSRKPGFQSSEKRGVIAFKSGILAVALFGLALLIANPLAKVYEDRIYETTLTLEEKLEDAFDASFSSDEGIINRGSNYHTGELVFNAATFREPRESIYLIKYRGGTYENSRWNGIDEEDFMTSTASYYSMDLQEVQSLFNTLYFQWNYVGVSGVDSNVRQLSIYSPELKYVAMRPYYAIRPETSTQDDAGNYSSLYYYYEGRELTEFPDDAEKSWAGMSDFANLYGDYAYSRYTEYPERQLVNLEALVKETPLSDLNEVTSFIIYTLGSKAKYTIKPGMAPFNRDIVEHFLFNSGLGYCQHYASTATLMYRMYGIPARYVTGFRLDPDDYTLRDAAEVLPLASSAESGENGEYEEAEDSGDSMVYYDEIPDSAAHAWFEIFIKGYGWVPVEVTPSTTGKFYPTYPGFNAGIMAQIQEAHGWVTDPGESIVEEVISEEIIPAAETVEEEASEESPGETAPVETFPEEPQQDQFVEPFPELIPEATIIEDQSPASPENTSDILRELGRFFKKLLLLAAAIGFFPLIMFLYRRYSLGKNENADVKVLFQKLLSMLKDCGLELPDRMDDPSIPEKISSFLTSQEGYSPITEDQARDIQEIVTGATFSNRPVSNENRSYVYNLYMDCAKKLYDEQSWFKQLIFRYIKVYL